MKSLHITFVTLALATLTTACSIDVVPPHSNLGTGDTTTPSQPATDPNDPGSATCSNGNALTSLTPTDYKYAFFLRDDWGTPVGTNESDIYVVITENPNFCVDGKLTGVDHDIPTLSIEHNYNQDASKGPNVITPGTFSVNVDLDTHPINGAPNDGSDNVSNGNNRVCDFYDHGGIIDNGGDTFSAGGTGTFTLQSYTPTTLSFTLDTTISTYTVPADRNEPAVFSGQTVHYALQAAACAFPPADESHGAPNGFDGAPTAACPGTNN